MFRITQLTIMLTFLGAFALSSCDREEVITVNIEFEEPTAGETVADASDVHIHVHFTAMGGDLHDLEVVLHPDGDVADKIIEFDGHEHAEEYVFMEDVNLSSYPSGTTFHLEAKACLDHDCAESEFGDIEFMIP